MASAKKKVPAKKAVPAKKVAAAATKPAPASTMTERQRLEGESPGNPTTGGVTPKLTPDGMDNLSERDREAAAAIVKAKTPHEKDQAALTGTGFANRGTAQAIVDHAKGEAERTARRAAEDAKRAPQPMTDADVPNEESNRLSREKAQHEEALRISAERTAERERALVDEHRLAHK